MTLICFPTTIIFPKLYNIFMCRGGLRVTTKTAFWIEWLDLLHLIHSQIGTTGNTALSLIHTLPSSPLHTHHGSQSSLVVSLQRSQCHFKSHMKSSLHYLIPFLSFFYTCQFRRLDSVQFLRSQAHILTGWRLETRLSSTAILCFFEILPYNHFAWTTRVYRFAG
jgi:hypothetical protein